MTQALGVLAVLFGLLNTSHAAENTNPTIGKAFLGISTGIQQSTNNTTGTSFALGGLIGYNIANPIGVQVFYYPQIGNTTAQIGGDLLFNFGNALRVFSLGARVAALIGGSGNGMSFGGKASLDYFFHPELSGGLEIVVQSGSASASFIMAVANLKLWM